MKSRLTTSVFASGQNLASRCGLVQRMAIVVLAVSLALSCNSLYYQLSGMSKWFSIIIIVAVLYLIVSFWLKTAIPKGALTIWVVWSVVILIVYVTLYFIGGSTGGVKTLTFICLLALSPLALYLLRVNSCLVFFGRCFVDFVALLSLISLVLWILGPVTSVLSPNTTITSSWTTVEKTYKGYFGLLFEVQTSTSLGLSVVRNTSVYVEAPMYSFTLCVALGVEMFLLGKSRWFVAAILAVSTVTTISTTGVMFLIFCFCLKFVLGIRKEDRLRWIKILALVAVACIGAVAAYWLFEAKMSTSSGSIRLDDFKAGFKAWSQHPIFGYGFDGGTAYLDFTSGFRSSNTGFSNSPMSILMRGGLVLFFPCLLGFLALFASGRKGVVAFGVLFLFLWTITLVYFLPVTAFCLSIGIMEAMCNEAERVVGRLPRAGRFVARAG